jgi:hypothetical protein
MRRIVVAMVVAGMVAAACTGGGPGSPPTGGGDGPISLAVTLVSFDACEDYLAYVKEQALEQVGPYGLGGGPMMFADDVVGERAVAEADDGTGGMPEPAPAAEPQAGVDFSETNVQEAGVDEPDRVKTDGRLLYTVSGDQVRIVDVTGDDPVLLGAVGVPGWDHRMLRSGDRLLVLTRSSWEEAPAGARPSVLLPDQQWREVSQLTLVNVADPANPVVESTTRLEGGYVSARMVEGVARVVVRAEPMGLPFVYPSSGQQAALDRATAVNREVIAESTVADWLPRYTRAQGEQTDEGYLVDCANVSRPVEFSGFGVLSVLTIDVGTGLAAGPAVGVLGTGDTVYASRESLYVSTTKWVPADQPEVSADEPMPGGRIMPVPAGATRTQLHKFDLTDPRVAVYRASGEIDGRVLNQYSLSELDGVLRVATTVGQAWGPDDDSESFVIALAERDGTLAEIGKVGGLGKGERIYSVRFIGDVGYVVTFRETDPLYTVDLSDPTSPRVLGELKILGYSAYLHPVGEGLLLGIGQDAEETGRIRGTQLSLFDVRDLAAPQRIAQLTLDEGTGSEAEYDPHAFLWWAAQNLAVIPVNRWSWDEQSSTFTSEAVGFTVESGAIAERGRIAHPQEPRLIEQEPYEGEPAPPPYIEPDWQAQITRSVVVGDRLLTLSEKGLKVSDLVTFADRGWLAY